jgi:hypothetical protein
MSQPSWSVVCGHVDPDEPGQVFCLNSVHHFRSCRYPFRPKPPKPHQFLPGCNCCIASIHPATLGVLAVKGLWPAKYTHGLSYGVTAPDPGLNWGQVSDPAFGYSPGRDICDGIRPWR